MRIPTLNFYIKIANLVIRNLYMRPLLSLPSWTSRKASVQPSFIVKFNERSVGLLGGCPLDGADRRNMGNDEGGRVR